MRDVSFDLAAGEMLALIGPNGAGKTTCFNMVNGQLKPDSGSVVLAGTELVGLRARPHLASRRRPHVPDRRDVRVADGRRERAARAALARRPRVRGWRSARAQFRSEALALLASIGMDAQAERAMSVLAYGDVKRVELAMALANQPRLLLMDEPTAGMGPAERNELMALTRRVARERSIGVLFTEHSMDVVFAHADRMIVLARGKLIAQGEPAVVRDDPQVREVYFGMGTTFGAAAGQPATRWCRRPDRARRAQRPGAATMLEVDALDAWYGKAQILYGVSLRVDEGECVALMGRNGAGKSTAMKTIMGLLAKRAGRVTYRGLDISTLPSHRIARLGLGWVPEDRRIFTDLTVRENLSVGRQPPREGAPHWTEEQLFALFPNLASMTDRPGGRMSGGEQQMLTIARTLMGNPHLILLDEPSEGVAPVIVEQMAQMIVKLKRRASRSCSRNRTCTSRASSPIAPSCSKRAGPLCRFDAGADGGRGRAAHVPERMSTLEPATPSAQRSA